ncbi:MAG: hypothetical protein AAF317_09640, partial [Pseudomonadota bacterium]
MMQLSVVGGNAWFSGALNALLDRDGEVCAVDVSPDPSSFAEQMQDDPQIAILASDFGRETLVQIISDWRRRYPDLRVVVRMRTLRPELVRDAMQAGAWGCFAEDDAPDIVLNVLKSVS